MAQHVAKANYILDTDGNTVDVSIDNLQEEVKWLKENGTALSPEQVTNLAKIPTLSSRLDEIDTIKANKDYVDNRVNTVVSGSPKGVYANLVALNTAKPTGDTGIYITQDNGNWNYWNGTAWQSGGIYVNSTKIASTNDLNKLTTGEHQIFRNTDFSYTEGKVLTTQGTISTSGGLNASLMGVTEYIDVKGFTSIDCLLVKTSGLGIASIAFFDSSNTLLSTYGQNSQNYTDMVNVKIPSNANKILYCYYTDSRATSTSLPILTNIVLKNENSNTNRIINIENDIILTKKNNTNTNNLFNKNDKDLMKGKELSPTGIIESANKAITGFISCNVNDEFYFYPSMGSQLVWFFDVNKNVISKNTVFNTTAGTKNTITTTDAKYIKINIANDKLENVIIKKGSKSLKSIEPYEVIKKDLIEGVNNTNINWWYGKKGDSLGDSLTGQGFFQKYTSMYFNLDSFKNNGIGGSRLSGDDVDPTRPSMWKDSRINALRSDADFITILGGQNDGDVVIGDISKTNMDVNTYVGAYNTIIDKIYKKYNGRIQIILCTPFYVPSEGDNGERFIKLDKAVKEIGQLHGLPVADFGGMSGANKYTKDVYWGSDKTHPIEDFYRDKVSPILVGTMENIKPIDYTKCNSIEYGVMQ